MAQAPWHEGLFCFFPPPLFHPRTEASLGPIGTILTRNWPQFWGGGGAVGTARTQRSALLVLISQSDDFTSRSRLRHSNRGDMSIENPGVWVPIRPRNHPDSAGWVVWGGGGWCIGCSCAFWVVFLAFGALVQGGQGCSSHAPALLGCATHTDWPHGKAPSAWHSAGSGAEVPNRATKHAICPMLQLCAFVDASGRL